MIPANKTSKVHNGINEQSTNILTIQKILKFDKLNYAFKVLNESYLKRF